MENDSEWMRFDEAMMCFTVLGTSLIYGMDAGGGQTCNYDAVKVNQ